MLRINSGALRNLLGKDLIAFGTGVAGRRIIPYLAQDPTLRLCGVTNSRITAEDDGTFMDTGLPVRSVKAWAKRIPNATILITSFSEIEEIIAVCKDAGFGDVELITGEMMNALIKVENQIAESRLTQSISSSCLALELHAAHKAAFAEFKGCNRGKTVAVVGTGSTLRHYKQIVGISHIGVNSSILKKDLVLEHYFVAHYVSEWCERMKEYNCNKFFATNRNSNATDKIPEFVIEENGGRKFYSSLTVPGIEAQTNIEYYPLMGYNSIIFPAIHFALYTRPKRILLIGCDCAANEHFDETPLGFYVERIQLPQWKDGYQKVKHFASVHYPDTEIISVNPIGLRGLFRDVYTQSYLNEHSELVPIEYEVIDSLLL